MAVPMKFIADFQKSIAKMDTVSTDFSPPTHWYHTRFLCSK
jgi:hypothetical protein